MKTKPKIYTEEYVKEEVDVLLRSLKENPDICYLGELIQDRPYSMQRISEWNNEFTGEISETIGKIKDILQTRAVVGGLKNNLNASITKFHLINNFDWKDKTETDITSGGETITPIYGGLSRHTSNQEDIQPDQED